MRSATREDALNFHSAPAMWIVDTVQKKASPFIRINNTTEDDESNFRIEGGGHIHLDFAPGRFMNIDFIETKAGDYSIGGVPQWHPLYQEGETTGVVTFDPEDNYWTGNIGTPNWFGKQKSYEIVVVADFSPDMQKLFDEANSPSSSKTTPESPVRKADPCPEANALREIAERRASRTEEQKASAAEPHNWV